MNVPETFHEVPNLVCPACRVVLTHGRDIQNAKKKVKKGDLYVCGKCGVISRLGDSNLIRMYPDDIKKLDNLTQMNLAAAVTGVKMYQENQGAAQN